jgi:hypothetical protein
MPAPVRAIVRTPSAAVMELPAGALIGRMPRSELYIADGRISEAHAMVSLRGQELLLLPLRGRLSVGGKVVPQVALKEGLRVELAPELELEVLEVVLPVEVLAIEVTGQPAQVLLGTSSVMVRGQTCELVPGWEPGAVARLWPQGPGCQLQRANLPAEPLEAGARVSLGPGVELRTFAWPLGLAGAEPTQLDVTDAPLRIVTRFHSAQVWRQGQELCTFSGTQAQCLSELVRFGGPTPWNIVARELWPEAIDEVLLRGRWDTTLSRVRARLRAAGVGRELVRSTHAGHVELALRPDDVLIDEA